MQHLDLLARVDHMTMMVLHSEVIQGITSVLKQAVFYFHGMSTWGAGKYAKNIFI